METCNNCLWFGYAGNSEACHNPASKEEGEIVSYDYSCEAWEQEGYYGEETCDE